MPDLAAMVDGNKFMWDGAVYETEKEAQEVKQKYTADGFEVEIIEQEGKHLVYSRRVVTEVVVDGEPPA